MKTKILMILLLILMYSCSTVKDNSDNKIQSTDNINNEEVGNEKLSTGLNELKSQPGEFVIYRNSFKDQNIITSIFFLGNDTFIIRTNNLITNEINQMQITAKMVNGEVEYDGFSVQEGNFGNMDLRSAHVDFLNMYNFYSKSDLSSYPLNIIHDDIWPGYILKHDFRSWVPVFNVYSKYLEEDPKNGLKLLRFGVLNQNNQDQIINFIGIETEEDNSPTLNIPKSETKEFVYDGLKLPLDENWIDIGNNTALYDVNGERYSYINVATYTKENLPLSSDEIFAWELKNSPMYIIPDTIEFTKTYDTPTLKYIVLDEFTQRKTTSTMFVYDRGEAISIVSFGAYTNFYNDNKEYFEKILF